MISNISLQRILNAGRTASALAKSGDWGAIWGRARDVFSDGRTPLPEALTPNPRAQTADSRPPLTDPRTVLMVTPGLARNGAPLSQFELACAIVAKGWRVSVASPTRGPISEYYAEAGIPLSIWPSLRTSPAAPAHYERDVSLLAEQLSALNPALIFSGTVDMFPAIDAARIAGLRSIWNIREGEDWRLRLSDRHPAIAARALACFSYCESVVFVSRATENAWRAFVPKGRSRVIYNAAASIAGLEEARMTPVVASKKIVSIGSVCERKGQADLVDALHHLPPDATIELVGEASGPYADGIRKRMAAQDARRIKFVGEVADVRPFLKGNPCLAHTARSEAFPRVFFEAAVAGAPIVTTSVGGVAERLEHGVSALFYDPGDVLELADAIRSIQDDGALAARLVSNARKALIDAWSIDSMADAYDSVLQLALAG